MASGDGLALRAGKNPQQQQQHQQVGICFAFGLELLFLIGWKLKRAYLSLGSPAKWLIPACPLPGLAFGEVSLPFPFLEKLCAGMACGTKHFSHLIVVLLSDRSMSSQVKMHVAGPQQAPSK